MLKEYRLRKHLSQEDLEKLTDLDRKTIFRLEHDKNSPNLDTFAIVTEALELTDQEIISEIRKARINAKKKKENKYIR